MYTATYFLIHLFIWQSQMKPKAFEIKFILILFLRVKMLKVK